MQHLSFAVGPGEILGLVGPNGAGKTTTLRSLAGIIPPTRGRIRIAGHDLAREAIKAKAALAFIPDEPQLFEYLTVTEHLQFTARLYRQPEALARVDALLAELRAAGFAGPARRAAFGDRPPAVIHSFSGPVDYALEIIEMDLAVSFSGLVFRPGEEPSAEVASLVPTERLLVETDSPFLSPPGAPRSRNEPCHVGITTAWVADCRGLAPEALGDDLIRAYDAAFAQPGA